MQSRFGTVVCALGFLALAAPLSHAAAQGAGSSISVEPDSILEKGRAIFTMRGCQSCHSIGKGVVAAPDLGAVMTRRSRDWLTRWLRDPEPMLDTDPVAKKMAKSFNGMRMPNLRLTDDEINAVLVYIEHNQVAK